MTIIFWIIIIAMIFCVLMAFFGGDKGQGIIVFLLPLGIILFFVLQCSDKQKTAQLEKEKKEREEFIKDSLAHDPHYQDSIRRAEARYLAWRSRRSYYHSKGIVGVVYGNDSVYHSCFHNGMRTIPDEYRNIYSPNLIDEADKLRFISFEEALLNKMEECETCEEIKRVYDEYGDGYLINIDDIEEYVDDDDDYDSYDDDDIY